MLPAAFNQKYSNMRPEGGEGDNEPAQQGQGQQNQGDGSPSPDTQGQSAPAQGQGDAQQTQQGENQQGQGEGQTQSGQGEGQTQQQGQQQTQQGQGEGGQGEQGEQGQGQTQDGQDGQGQGQSQQTQGQQGQGEGEQGEQQGQVDINKEIAERTQGKFNDIDELLQKAESPAIEGNPIETIDKTLNDNIGMGLDEYQRYQNMDINNLNETDKLREYMKIEDPGITEKELDVNLKKFSPLFKTSEEREKMVSDGEISRDHLDSIEAEYQRKLRDADNKLTEKKKKVDEFDWQKAGLNNAQNSQELEQQKQQWKKETSEGLKSVAKDDIPIGEDKSIEYQFDANDDSTFQKYVEDPEQVFSRWINKDNTMNYKQMKRDLTLLENTDKIMKMSYDKGVAEGQKKNVQDMNNTQTEPSDKQPQDKAPSPGDNSPESKRKSVLQEMYGDRNDGFIKNSG